MPRFLPLAFVFREHTANGVLEVSVQQSSKVGNVEDILRSSHLVRHTLWLLQIEKLLACFVALRPHQVTHFKRVLQVGVLLLQIVRGHLRCVRFVDQRVVACEKAIICS